MSWLRQPAILAVPSRASRSKSAGYWTGERLGFRQTEHLPSTATFSPQRKALRLAVGAGGGAGSEPVKRSTGTKR